MDLLFILLLTELRSFLQILLRPSTRLPSLFALLLSLRPQNQPVTPLLSRSSLLLVFFLPSLLYFSPHVFSQPLSLSHPILPPALPGSPDLGDEPHRVDADSEVYRVFGGQRSLLQVDGGPSDEGGEEGSSVRRSQGGRCQDRLLDLSRIRPLRPERRRRDKKRLDGKDYYNDDDIDDDGCISNGRECIR